MDALLNLTNYTYAYPLAFLIPALFLFASIMHRSESPAVAYPKIDLLLEIPPSLRAQLRTPILNALLAAAIIFLSLAAARPQRVTVVDQSAHARNIMLALDVSRSMSADDFHSEQGDMTRIDGVKYVVGEFIKSRTDDRIGVVVFGSTSLLLSPLTLDHSLVAQLVDKLQLGIAQDGTAIGDGLGLSLKRLRDIEGKANAIVLVTDGSNNSGQVNPIKAAKIAADLGIKIHTIGIGSSTPVTIRAPSDFFYNRIVKQVEFDEKTLKEIAETTGGVYFNAQSIEGLQEVYDEIDKLDKSESETPAERKVEEFFAGFAVCGLIFLLSLLTLSRTFFLKIP